MAVETISRRVICFLFLFLVVDITISSLLFGHISQFQEHLITEAKFFTFSTSVLEFWVFSLIRATVLVGFLIGVCCNGTQECIHRLEKANIPMLILAVAFGIYGVIKMLAYSEESENIAEKAGIWFWSQFAWIEFASLGFYVSYYLLKTYGICEIALFETQTQNSINQVDEERQCLLNSHNAEDEISVEIKQRTTMQKASSVMRLLRYSKPDIPYVAIASLFMVLSSVGKF